MDLDINIASLLWGLDPHMNFPNLGWIMVKLLKLGMDQSLYGNWKPDPISLGI